MTDSSVNSIKANINFTNTNIYNNDLFLSARTQSVVGFTNTNNVTLTGSLIQMVSSTIELTNVIISNIMYTSSQDSVTSFYKIQIVNKSKFFGTRLTLSIIAGPLLYISAS